MSTLIEDVARIIFFESKKLIDTRDDRTWDCVVHEPWLALARNVISHVHAHDVIQSPIDRIAKRLHTHSIPFNGAPWEAASEFMRDAYSRREARELLNLLVEES